MAEKKYIASLDVGTTTIRCFVFDENFNIKGAALAKVELLSPQQGYFEINPTQLWDSIVNTVNNAIRDAKLLASNITCIALSTQRSTFITWDKETNEYFHNFITWKDLRADTLVKEWNSSYLLALINKASYGLYILCRSKRFLAGSVLKFMNEQITMRLLWQIVNNQRLKDAIKKNSAVFGTLDSWLLYKLRKGNGINENIDHISDITSCAATGIFDPFTLKWADWALSLFSIKKEMLPRVVDITHNFGFTSESIFGSPIKIACSMSDQSSSLWGSTCFNNGDIKVTLGTGSFMNINTGKSCSASVHGLYPLVAWQIKCNNSEELVYCVEGSANDTGTIINWAINFGLFDDAAKSSDIAESVHDSDGVFFIPAFSGLGPPINDSQAATGFIGVRPTTRKAHLVRALLESVSFRIAQLYFCTLTETNYEFTCIKVDGGVSKNNFVCQVISDITGLKVMRPKMSESSALGAAFVAALNTNIWSSKTDLEQFYSVEKVFTPRGEMKQKYENRIKMWEQAIERFKGWYEHDIPAQ